MTTQNPFQHYVKSLSDAERQVICDNYIAYEARGSIGDEPLRRHAEALMRLPNVVAPVVVVMERLAFEAFRFLALQARQNKIKEKSAKAKNPKAPAAGIGAFIVTGRIAGDDDDTATLVYTYNEASCSQLLYEELGSPEMDDGSDVRNNIIVTDVQMIGVINDKGLIDTQNREIRISDQAIQQFKDAGVDESSLDDLVCDVACENVNGNSSIAVAEELASNINNEGMYGQLRYLFGQNVAVERILECVKHDADAQTQQRTVSTNRLC